jgi:hypothetical protein
MLPDPLVTRAIAVTTRRAFGNVNSSPRTARQPEVPKRIIRP